MMKFLAFLASIPEFLTRLGVWLRRASGGKALQDGSKKAQETKDTSDLENFFDPPAPGGQ
jgi:hypothetical protein